MICALVMAGEGVATEGVVEVDGGLSSASGMFDWSARSLFACLSKACSSSSRVKSMGFDLEYGEVDGM